MSAETMATGATVQESVMTESLTEPEIFLRALLSQGPRNSRDMLTMMGERGFSAKVTRRAREKQGVVAQREGGGTDTRTIWRLPDGSDGGGQAGAPALSGQTTPTAPMTPEIQATAAGVDVPPNAIDDAQQGVVLPLMPTDTAMCEPARMLGFVEVFSVSQAQGTVTAAAATGHSLVPALLGNARVEAEVQVAPTHHKDPLQRAREIRTMEHPELRLYAKQIGVRQRDIDELSIDRLRQNCMLTVASLIEAYTE